jgi:putative heme iron utilization protein
MAPPEHGNPNGKPDEHGEAYESQAKRISHAESARTLPVMAGRGVLSTLDEDDGCPYGSLAEFITTDDGDAVFFLSDLAAHTANFKADGRASLFVSQEMASVGPNQRRPLALERVTLLGDIEQVDDREKFRPAYLDHHPQAATYIDFSDFSFWRLNVRRVRFIGGFGRMSWVEKDAYRNAHPDPIATMGASAIDHMNHDHGDALLDYVRAFSDVDSVAEATMLSIDRLGFDLEARDASGDDHLVRVHFDEPLEHPSEVRKAMVDQVHKAREILE